MYLLKYYPVTGWYLPDTEDESAEARLNRELKVHEGCQFEKGIPGGVMFSELFELEYE